MKNGLLRLLWTRRLKGDRVLRTLISSMSLLPPCERPNNPSLWVCVIIPFTLVSPLASGRFWNQFDLISVVISSPCDDLGEKGYDWPPLWYFPLNSSPYIYFLSLLSARQEERVREEGFSSSEIEQEKEKREKAIF